MGCCQQNQNKDEEYHVDYEENNNFQNENLEVDVVKSKNPAFNKVIEVEDLNPSIKYNSNDISMNIDNITNLTIKMSTINESTLNVINNARNEILNKNELIRQNNVNNENCDGDNLNADKNIKCKFDNSTYNKSIILRIIESKIQEITKTIRIDPKNNESSNYYFGHNSNSEQSVEENNYFNFIKEDGLKEKHFVIKLYDSLDLSPGYYIKNINGSGLFLNISEKQLIKNNMIITFGSNYILVNINKVLLKDPGNENDVEKLEKVSVISFKIIKGLNNNEE